MEAAAQRMTRYFQTERGHGTAPDTPSWLDRRWRWTKQPPIERQMRRTLLLHALREYGPNCHWCGRETFWPERRGIPSQPLHRTLEHLIPRGMGGKDTFENTRIACYECNTTRGIWQEWLIWWHRLKIMAPNRIFGSYIIGDEAV